MERTGISGGSAYRGGLTTRLFSRVLMAKPDFFAITEPKNPFAFHHPPVDLPLAHRQWEQLLSAFQQARLDVSILDPFPGLEDMCFTASQAFVGVDAEDRSFVIPSRMLHRSRRDEVEHFVRWYVARGYRVLDLNLEDEEFLEGSSDLLWDMGRDLVWAGYGHRSTRGAVDQFTATMEGMGFGVRKLELVDPHFYHLNLCLAPLTPETLLIYPGAFAPETLAQIRRWVQTAEVTREEALQFVCNGLAVNGTYITPRLNHRLERILSQVGLEPIVVELSEFEKSGGSVASLKMLLP